MPDFLRKIPFGEELLKEVADFDCGDEEWELPLAAWIKAPPNVKNGALYELRNRKGKLSVWLHVNGVGDLVGYSALGASNWEWPTAEDPRVPISVIPNVAIQKRYWGCPKEDPPRYSTQILEHQIFEARRHQDRHPLLGLFVHPMNARAIKAYQAAGFAEHFRKFTDNADNVEYVSMLLNVADTPLSA
jgi:hypothetical protein